MIGALLSWSMAALWIVVAVRMADRRRGASSLAASWLAVIFAVIGILAAGAANAQP